MTSRRIRRSTYSPASADGVEQLDLLAGLTTDRSGAAAVPVSHSAPPASVAALAMSDTSGLTCAASSPAATLQSLLASRLSHLLDVTGSPEYVLTWKTWPMKSGEPICALRGSGRRTSGSESIGWPTPGAEIFEPRDLEALKARRERFRISAGNGNGFGLNLAQVVQLLAPWPTPTGDDANNATRESGNFQSLTRTALLAGWATPTTRDHKGVDQNYHDGAVNNSLPNQVAGVIPSGWSTPRAEDAESAGMRHSRGVADTLSAQVGQDLSGYHAGTEKRGALNPALSRWLMGYPVAWDACAPTAMPSSRSLRRSSSKPTSDAGHD